MLTHRDHMLPYCNAPSSSSLTLPEKSPREGLSLCRGFSLLLLFGVHAPHLASSVAQSNISWCWCLSLTSFLSSMFMCVTFTWCYSCHVLPTSFGSTSPGPCVWLLLLSSAFLSCGMLSCLLAALPVSFLSFHNAVQKDNLCRIRMRLWQMLRA